VPSAIKLQSNPVDLMRPASSQNRPPLGSGASELIKIAVHPAIADKNITSYERFRLFMYSKNSNTVSRHAAHDGQ